MGAGKERPKNELHSPREVLYIHAYRNSIFESAVQGCIRYILNFPRQISRIFRDINDAFNLERFILTNSMNYPVLSYVISPTNGVKKLYMIELTKSKLFSAIKVPFQIRYIRSSLKTELINGLYTKQRVGIRPATVSR
jgi:hypothetical protein